MAFDRLHEMLVRAALREVRRLAAAAALVLTGIAISGAARARTSRRHHH
ncbi:hypothetical protein [Micromonospora cremea]|nr:hypothetical protein [Micromonospora cremea]